VVSPVKVKIVIAQRRVGSNAGVVLLAFGNWFVIVSPRTAFKERSLCLL
jgi:hypothetical protein